MTISSHSTKGAERRQGPVRAPKPGHGRPGHGMAIAVEKIGAVLVPILPPKADNPDELPNRLITL